MSCFMQKLDSKILDIALIIFHELCNKYISVLLFVDNILQFDQFHLQKFEILCIMAIIPIIILIFKKFVVSNKFCLIHESKKLEQARYIAKIHLFNVCIIIFIL